MSLENESQARGPVGPYRPKDPLAKSVSLTPLGKRILTATAQRLGLSESNVVEHLLRTHAGQLTFEPVVEQTVGE